MYQARALYKQGRKGGLSSLARITISGAFISRGNQKSAAPQNHQFFTICSFPILETKCVSIWPFQSGVNFNSPFSSGRSKSIKRTNWTFFRSYRSHFRETLKSNIEMDISDDFVLDEFELKKDGTLGVASFTDIGIHPSLCKSLQNEGIATPTSVQDRALPITLSRKHHCIIKSETGSGKTLTFLLPALQEKLPGLTTLILVPTRELAVQMMYQATKLSKDKRGKRLMVMYTGSCDDGHLLEKYNEIKPHVLIATPKPIVKLFETNRQDFVNLRRLVLDEADKLLHISDKRVPTKKPIKHVRPTNLIIDQILSLKHKYQPQFIATSATLNKSTQEELTQIGWGEHPKILSVSESLSKSSFVSPSTIKHCYVECDDTSLVKTSQHFDKIDALCNHFRTNKDKSALVFIHRGAPVTQFIHQLQKRFLRVAALHENVSDPTHYEKFLDAFKSGEIECVVATEETVRGLDFAWLDTVYLLEVPRTANEYLHLCGRVGRVKRRGRSVVIIENSLERKRLHMHYKKLGVTGKCITPSRV